MLFYGPQMGFRTGTQTTKTRAHTPALVSKSIEWAVNCVSQCWRAVSSLKSVGRVILFWILLKLKTSSNFPMNLFLIYGIMVSRQLHEWEHQSGVNPCMGVSRDNLCRLGTNTGCGDQKIQITFINVGWEFSSLGFFYDPSLFWSLVFVESFLATLVQNINFLVKSAEKVKWSGGGEHKREYFSMETNFDLTTRSGFYFLFRIYGPVEVISAVDVVVAEETFTVKCFLTMMAPKSKKVEKNLVKKYSTSHIPHATCDQGQLIRTWTSKLKLYSNFRRVREPVDYWFATSIAAR